MINAERLRKISELAHSVDKFFYFVCVENLGISKAMTDNISRRFAALLELNNYACRSGKDVQTPKNLAVELYVLGLPKFEIILVGQELPEISMLSYDQKAEFLNSLNDDTRTTGQIALEIIDGSDSTEIPEYKPIAD